MKDLERHLTFLHQKRYYLSCARNYRLPDHIESPELINGELEQKIRLIDLVDKDLELKIKTAYILKELYEINGLNEGLFSNIIIERFDLINLIDTNFAVAYIEILKNNGTILNEIEREILERVLHYEALNYK
jgi:hypothetical protein